MSDPQTHTTETAQVRNEFGEIVRTLADFADEVDVIHPLTERRIPVVNTSHPRWKYHTALFIGPDWIGEAAAGIEPEPWEVEQLLADLEYRMEYYNAAYRARVEARGPFDVDGTVNTHIFRKHPEHGWQYRVMSWTQGATWFPTPPWDKSGPFTLAELLDHVHTFGDGPPMPRWVAIKDASGAFTGLATPPAVTGGGPSS